MAWNDEDRKKFNKSHPDYKKEYYLKNKDRICQQVKKYALDNPEKIKKADADKYAKNRIKILKRMRKYAKSDIGRKVSLRTQLKKYGATTELYTRMFNSQGGVCLMCGKSNENGYRLSIDHNHFTGKIRGLLCTGCNSKLGMVENLEFLESAIKYLKEYD
jgi:hypothetical protein